VNIKSVMFILWKFWGGYLVVVSIRRNVFHSTCTDKLYLKEKDAVWNCWIEVHYESMKIPLSCKI